MTDFPLGACLHRNVNSDLALSLPQSRCFNPFSPRQLPPQREPRRLPPQSTDLALLSMFGVNAMPCRGYNPSVSFADSSPYTVGFRAPPVADTARKASRCRPQVRERIAEARAANGEGAEVRAQCALPRAAPPHSADSLRYTLSTFCGRRPHS